MKRFIRKSWYTLTEAANYLTQSTEDESKVTVSDLLQLAMDNELSLSLRLTRHLFHGMSEGKVISPAYLIADGVTWNDAEEVEVQSFARARIMKHGGITIEMSPRIVVIVHHGGGQRLLNHLWARSIEGTAPNTSKVTIDEMLRSAIAGPDAMFDESVTFAADVGKATTWTMPISAIPEDSYLVVRTADLDKLLSQSAISESAYQDIPPTTADDDSEIARLQRTVAGLALGLMREYPKYRHGDKPNISKLTDLATDHLRSENGDRPPHGFGKSTISDAIKAALERYRELSE
jgi:hypothetical protein